MTNGATKKSLSPARTHLVELMHEIGYGRIVDLHVRDGEPVFDPPPVAKRIYQFGKDAASRPVDSRQGLLLKKKVHELLEIFDREGSLHIEELKIEDGLPVSMSVTKKGRA
jgi:hypothetical protein